MTKQTIDQPRPDGNRHVLAVRNCATVFINGVRHDVPASKACLMLADYLRYEAGLVGTKIVCAEGDCGACSVLRASALLPGQTGFEPINACIITMAQLDGTQLITIEGVETGNHINPVQTAVVTCHGSQCGYCTPGFVMTLTALCQKNQNLDEQRVKNALTGNLCRCTGYAPLIQAALTVHSSEMPSLDTAFHRPEVHETLTALTAAPLHLVNGSFEFFAPTTLESALNIRKANPSIRLISSATDLGVQINKGLLPVEKYLSLHLIPELYAHRIEGQRLYFGARVSLSEVRRACESLIPEFMHFLDIFASPQIKNIATLVGNVANASPIGDSIPFLMVSDAVVDIIGPGQRRQLPLTELYAGYRHLALGSDEMIIGISFRIPETFEHLRIYKVSQRKDLDISTVNGAFLFHVDKISGAIVKASIALGGIAPTVLRMSRAEAFLNGKTLDAAVVEKTLEIIQDDIKPLSDLRGSAAYRRTLVDGLFRKYCDELQMTETTHVHP